MLTITDSRLAKPTKAKVQQVMNVATITAAAIWDPEPCLHPHSFQPDIYPHTQQKHVEDFPLASRQSSAPKQVAKIGKTIQEEKV